MASKRKSFVLHIDSLDILDDLTDEQAGQLFKAIKSHHKGEISELCPLVKIAFSPFKNQFARDDEKYQKIVERNKNNGLKGGRPKTQDNPEKPTGLSGNPDNPQKADNDSDSKSVNDSDSKKDKLDWSATQMSESEIKEIKRIRKSSKADVSQRVINQLAKQFDLSRKRGFTNDDILNEWSIKGWRSYKDEWMKGQPTRRPEQQLQIEIDPQQQRDELSQMFRSMGGDK